MVKKKEIEEFDDYAQVESKSEVEVMEVIFILHKKWKFIMGSMILTAILGGVFAFTRPDVYKSQSQLMVSSGNIYSVQSLDSSELSRNQKLVATYTEIAKSKLVVEKVATKLDMNEDLKAIAKRIVVSPVEDTELINISFTDGNPRTAMVFVNEVSKEFMARVKNIMNFQNLKIVEEAKETYSPEPKKQILIVAIAAVLGAILGIALTLGMEFIHGKIRKPEDIEKILACQVIGNLPDFEVLVKKGGK